MNRHDQTTLSSFAIIGATDWSDLGRRVREAAEVAAQQDPLSLADVAIAKTAELAESTES